MDDFERDFNDIRRPDFTGEDVGLHYDSTGDNVLNEDFQGKIRDFLSKQEAARQKQEEIRQAKELADQETNAITEQIKKLTEQINELNAQAGELKARRNKRQARDWELHQQWKAAKRDEENALSEIEHIKRQQALEAEAKRQAEKQRAIYKSIEDLTSEASWREFAYTHQLDGSTFMAASQRCIVADEMGLGKTLQSLMALDKLEAIGESKGRVLVIAPGEIITNFQVEGEKWFDERGFVNIANLGTKGTLEAIDYWIDTFGDDELIFLINYEILARSFEVVERLIQWQPDTVILDEAHRIKNMSTNSYRALEQIILGYNQCAICEGMTWPRNNRKGFEKIPMSADNVHCVEKHGDVEGKRSVRNVFPMTGTPIRNKPMDIFPLLHLCAPHIFTDIHDFEYTYCHTNFDGTVGWSASGHSRLIRKIRGMYIGRKRSDTGIKLPPQEVKVHDIEPGEGFYEKQRKILKMLKERAMIEVEEGRVKGVVSMLAVMTRSRQASVWPGGIWMDEVDPITGVVSRIHVGQHYQESAKLDKAVSLLKEFTENEQRSVVFSAYLEPLLEMERRLNAMGIRAVLYAGPTDRVTRDLVKRNFDRNSGEVAKWDVVLAHYTLGGEGLNLTACTQMILLDENWSPAGNDQAVKRIDRGGQTEGTTVHILRLKMTGSFDGAMAALIAKKRAMIDTFDQEFKIQDLEEILRNS